MRRGSLNARGAAAEQRPSGTTERLDMRSEQQIIDVPVDRGICCHVGGDIVFDRAGNLILSTGDDTNPFESDGYTPIDERADRNPAFDAQRTAANTNDLRGKVLRIRPGQRAATRSRPGTCSRRGRRTRVRRSTRWASATRSGSRSTATTTTSTSPTTRRTTATRTRCAGRPGRASGRSCASRATTAGRTARALLPYVDYDFATGRVGATFNCASPGQRVAAQHRAYGSCRRYAARRLVLVHAVGGVPRARHRRAESGRWAARIRLRPAKASSPAWPAYFDGVPLFYEWTRDYIKEFRLNAAGDVAAITPSE